MIKIEELTIKINVDTDEARKKLEEIRDISKEINDRVSIRTAYFVFTLTAVVMFILGVIVGLSLKGV